ncbi:MAG: ABC transporter ATP-binding protein [Anaerolineales bacterium]|nr:ABC transporter ATP-binding protein [Anaerolineales bacterium]MCX7753664.1 ABC transporter ATP-binding protein [Anaerolineales bacterium]MDW8279147.1 ABC transporter ATP-binding protein [Anaerolineales bacterium]
MLTTSSLTIGYHHPLASELNLELRPAELVCLIGPNGVGKSTLLRTLAGMEKPLAGTVWLAGQNLHHLPPRELAKRLAIVLTGRVESPLLTARELVSLGRHPYTDWLGRLTPRDEEAIQRAMQLTDTLRFSARPLAQLSDGERQKVMIARALAQEPGVLLLDEPTAFLDLPRRVELLQLLRHLARETHTAVLLSTHDLDLALRLADRLWLLSSAGTMEVGLPEELALGGAVARVFQSEGAYFDHAIGAFRVHQPVSGPVSLSGGQYGVTAAWTWRALERVGYQVHNGSSRHAVHIEILAESRWRLLTPSGQSEHASLQSLLHQLSCASHENLL